MVLDQITDVVDEVMLKFPQATRQEGDSQTNKNDREGQPYDDLRQRLSCPNAYLATRLPNQ